MAEEYFDIVNENNEIIGQELRRIVHRTGLWHPGVHVFLFTPDGRLLIQKRSQTRDTFPGTLDCSVSEHLKPGELYLAAAVRGLREELGVDGIPFTRLVQFKMYYGPNDNEFSEVYEGVWDDSPITIDPHEVDEIGFYTIPELEEIMARGDPPIAPWFLQLFRWYIGKPTEMEAILWARR
ncbi:MAG: NUDIX domain-containing protein [Chloroflexota bacterium]